MGLNPPPPLWNSEEAPKCPDFPKTSSLWWWTTRSSWCSKDKNTLTHTNTLRYSQIETLIFVFSRDNDEGKMRRSDKWMKRYRGAFWEKSRQDAVKHQTWGRASEWAKQQSLQNVLFLPWWQLTHVNNMFINGVDVFFCEQMMSADFVPRLLQIFHHLTFPESVAAADCSFKESRSWKPLIRFTRRYWVKDTWGCFMLHSKFDYYI